MIQISSDESKTQVSATWGFGKYIKQAKTLVKTSIALGLMSFVASIQGSARAAPAERIKASVDCGSFQLNSVTDQIKVPDQFTRATFQVIHLVNRSRQIDKHLDLKQHASQDGQLGGMLDIDGVATEWWCIHTKSGADFVFIDFVCSEEDARSCSTAMGAPSADWRQIYDSEGRAIFKRPPEASEEEEASLKTLGVFKAFYAPIESDPSRQIYDAY